LLFWNENASDYYIHIFEVPNNTIYKTTLELRRKKLKNYHTISSLKDIRKMSKSVDSKNTDNYGRLLVAILEIKEEIGKKCKWIKT
jgi:hypothetical protein